MALQIGGAQLIWEGGLFGGTRYIGLHSGVPGANGANELAGNNYGRAVVTTALRTIANTGAVTINNVAFPTPSGPWADPTHGAVYSAANGGNPLFDFKIDNDPEQPDNGFAVEFNAANDLIVTPVNAQMTNPALNAMMASGLLSGTAWVSLHSGAPGTTGANELAGSNYARVAVAGNTGWSFNSANGTAANSTSITFPTPSADWADVTHVALRSAAVGGGNVLWRGPLSNNPDPAPQGSAVSFAVGVLTFPATIANAAA